MGFNHVPSLDRPNLQKLARTEGIAPPYGGFGDRCIACLPRPYELVAGAGFEPTISQLMRLVRTAAPLSCYKKWCPRPVSHRLRPLGRRSCIYQHLSGLNPAHLRKTGGKLVEIEGFAPSWSACRADAFLTRPYPQMKNGARPRCRTVLKHCFAGSWVRWLPRRTILYLVNWCAERDLHPRWSIAALQIKSLDQSLLWVPAHKWCACRESHSGLRTGRPARCCYATRAFEIIPCRLWPPAGSSEIR